jgi:hypothetical protein
VAKYRKWNSSQALSEAKERIFSLSKRESIEKGLYAEWMADYRARIKSYQLYCKLVSNLELDKEILIESIVNTVGNHEDRTYIAERLIKSLSLFVDALNREPKSPLTMLLKLFTQRERIIRASQGIVLSGSIAEKTTLKLKRLKDVLLPMQ